MATTVDLTRATHLRWVPRGKHAVVSVASQKMEAMTQSALIVTASLALTWWTPAHDGGACGGVCADTLPEVHLQGASASVGDTLAHPIMLACGERLDPVCYVLGAAIGLGLSSEQQMALRELDRVVRERNLPLAAHRRSRRDQEAPASLRDSHRAAVGGRGGADRGPVGGGAAACVRPRRRRRATGASLP